MNTINGILKKLFLFVCIYFAMMLNGCTIKSDVPDFNELAKDFLQLMQKTTVNFGASPQKLSDYYKLVRFERIKESEMGNVYRIEFKGEVELLETIHSYGIQGMKRYFLPHTLDQNSGSNRINKGTIIAFTGRADYELTDKGWANQKRSVLIKSEPVPRT